MSINILIESNYDYEIFYIFKSKEKMDEKYKEIEEDYNDDEREINEILETGSIILDGNLLYVSSGVDGPEYREVEPNEKFEETDAGIVVVDVSVLDSIEVYFGREIEIIPGNAKVYTNEYE